MIFDYRFLVFLICLLNAVNSIAADGNFLCEQALLSSNVGADQNLIAYLKELLSSGVVTRSEIDVLRNDLSVGKRINPLSDSNTIARVVAEPILEKLLSDISDFSIVISDLDAMLVSEDSVQKSSRDVSDTLSDLHVLIETGSRDELIDITRKYFSLENNIDRPDLLRKLILRARDFSQVDMVILTNTFSNSNWVSHPELLELLIDETGFDAMILGLEPVFIETDVWDAHPELLVRFIKKMEPRFFELNIDKLLKKDVFLSNPEILKLALTHLHYKDPFDFMRNHLTRVEMKVSSDQILLEYIRTPEVERRGYIDSIFTKYWLNGKIIHSDADRVPFVLDESLLLGALASADELQMKYISAGIMPILEANNVGINFISALVTVLKTIDFGKALTFLYEVFPSQYWSNHPEVVDYILKSTNGTLKMTFIDLFLKNIDESFWEQHAEIFCVLISRLEAHAMFGEGEFDLVSDMLAIQRPSKRLPLEWGIHRPLLEAEFERAKARAMQASEHFRMKYARELHKSLKF